MKTGVLAALALLATVAGCASARVSDTESTRLFREGKYEESASLLREGLQKQLPDGRDQLLYLLDLGLALHSAGQFEESNKVFLEADKVAEIKDYTSLATESGTLLVGENIKDYKAEDFEYVMISTYLAMNYALAGNNEDALVEARRVNRKLSLMVSQGQRKYKQNAFARYLSAILYESEGDANNAYVDYKMTFNLEPDFPGLGKDLWRMAHVLRMSDEMERWDERFGLTAEDHKEAKRVLPKTGNGEVIVLFENGISPIKRPNPRWNSIPKFYPRSNPVTHAEVELNGKVVGPTARLHDIERTAIENLEEKYGGMIAKKVGGVVAKEVVANQIENRTNSPVLGAIARVAFYASDQADLRSWYLLPKDLQIARFAVDPGVYKVRLLPTRGPAGAPAGAPPTVEKEIRVEAGRKVFVNFRYMP